MNTTPSFKISTHQIITSITTLPVVVLDQIGVDSFNIIHTYYNPEHGWEIAFEDRHHKTHIVICKEQDKIVKLYSQ